MLRPRALTRLTARTSVLDPVDVATGECFVQRTDFRLPGPIPVEWKAYYSSLEPEPGPLGWGWAFPYAARLLAAGDGACFLNGAGGEVGFAVLPAAGEEVPGGAPGYALSRYESGALGVTVPDGTTWGFVGSESGIAVLARIVDRNGHVIRIDYGRRRELARIHDTAGRTLEVATDEAGRIVEVLCGRPGSSSQVLVRYGYDRAGNLSEVMDAAGASQRYEYDAAHQLVRRTDRNGYSFHYEYAAGRVLRTWGDDGLFRGEFAYDAAARRTVVTGFDGRRTEFRCDPAGRVLEEIDSYDHATKHLYAPAGQRVLTTDRLGRATVTKYDEQGNVVERLAPTGLKRTYAYDDERRLLREEGPAGASEYAYDERGNRVREVDAQGEVTTHGYDSLGRRTSTRRGEALPQVFRYDAFHQLAAICNACGVPLVRYEYDLLGNVVAETRADGRTWYAYDAMSRMTAVHYRDGTSERSTYDAEGNATSFTDRTGRRWGYRYRSYRQLSEVVNPDGSVVGYERTSANELSVVSDPLGNRTEYVYDRTDRITAVRRNGVVLEEYTRDAEGRLVGKSGPNGEMLARFAYETADRPTLRVIVRDGQAVTSELTYDPVGRIVAASDRFARVARAFHPRGMIAAEACNDRGVEHTFDAQGRLTQTEFGDGIGFRLEHVDGMTLLRDPVGGWHALSLDQGRVDALYAASGVKDLIERDAEGKQVAHRVIGRNGATYLQSREEYDPRGRVGKHVRPDRGLELTYVYDADERLTEVRAGTGRARELFRYDAAGNRLPSRGAGSIRPGNRLAEWGARRFEYDERGRLSAERAPQRTRTFRYDTADQLTTVLEGSAVVAAYEYDALRRRVAKTVYGQRTEFGWEGTRLAWELAPDGTRRCYFYPDPASHSPLMFCDDRPLPTGDRVVRVYLVHYDRGQRPVLITDEAGRNVWSAEWTAYGAAEVRSAVALEYNPRAAGQYADSETGLHYNYHRYYDPELGRFTTPDPIGLAGGLNLYEYLGGDPLHGCEILGLAGA